MRACVHCTNVQTSLTSGTTNTSKYGSELGNKSLCLKMGTRKPMGDATETLALNLDSQCFPCSLQPVLWLHVLSGVTDIRYQRRDVHDRENLRRRQYNCPWSNIQSAPILPPQPRFEVLIEVAWFIDSYACRPFSLRLSGSWWMQKRLRGRTGVVPSWPTTISSHQPEATRSFSLSLALLFLNKQTLDSIWL